MHKGSKSLKIAKNEDTAMQNRLQQMSYFKWMQSKSVILTKRKFNRAMKIAFGR